MKRRLQEFDHRSSGYERPNLLWTCGHAAEGTPCRRGPGSKGQCRTRAECRPVKVGDRWQCTRPDSAGGPCGDGPFPDGSCGLPVAPCVPVRSPRARRVRAVQYLGIATLGWLFLALGADPTRWLTPGPVSRSHVNVQVCGTCHSAFDRGPAGWLAAAIGGADAEVESGKCLVCHTMGENAMRPHAQAPERLAAISERHPTAAEPGEGTVLRSLSESIVRPSAPLSSLPCGRCHREHRGRDADISHVSDSRCQTCHRLQFPSFADGHPPFEGYPSDRPKQIHFDHNRHFNRHFPASGKQPPESCSACHVPDLYGQQMIVRLFDDTCAGCHLGQIDGTDRTTGTRAIAVLVVPGLDVETLSENGHAVGEWPYFAEDAMTPFMRLLLAGDPELRRDLRRFLAIDDPLDLRDAGEEDLAAAARVAWAVKELIYDLLVIGGETLAERLESTTGRRMNRGALADLVGALPRDAVGAAQLDWFPDLMTEVPLYRSGTFQGGGATEAAEPIEDTSEEIDGAAAPDQPVASAEDDDDLLVAGGDDDLLASDDDLLAADDDLLGGDDDLLAADDDLLGGDDDLLGEEGGDLLADDEIWSDDEEIFDLAEPAAEVESLVELPAIDPEQWASLGGWYRREFSLYYRPVGHADRFMRTWLDVLAATYGSDFQPLAGALFENLIDPIAPGACGKCHSVDRVDDGLTMVRWSAPRDTEIETDFTVFSHVTHFSLAGGGRCVSCHSVRSSPATAEPAVGVDRLDHGSSFSDIDKSLCAQCHVKGAAGEACTQCHGYHVGVARNVAPADSSRF